MSERLSDIDSQLAYWQQRKAGAMEVVLEANSKILELGSERNRLGKVATRHLALVPDLPPQQSFEIPDGVA